MSLLVYRSSCISIAFELCANVQSTQPWIRAQFAGERADAMTRRKSTGRPKRLRGVKSNMVAAAVELAGGVTAVARLCGVVRQSVYTWIQQGRVERLIDALKLARASGIPIERLAGDAFKPQKIPDAKTPALSSESDQDYE
jgi:transposase-like protein